MIKGIIASSIQTGAGFTPLLDTYTGAGAAFSLRKLSSSSTSAIRIERDSDASETDIGFSGENLDQATINTFCSGTSCYVVKWYDQSGNNYHLDFDPGNAVIYESGSIITANGNPAVEVRGASELTTVGANHDDFFASNQTHCVSVIQCSATGTFESQILGLTIFSNTDFSFLGYIQTQNFVSEDVAFYWSDFTYNAQAESYGLTGWHIVEGQVVSSSDSNVYVDNTDATTTESNASWTPTSTDYTLSLDYGGADFVKVQELIQWPVNHSSDRGDIHANINGYWN